MADALWGPLFDEPVLVLTGDQDWAPDWALERMLRIAGERRVPLHLFVTSASPLLRPPPAGVTLGVHPNVLPGSTHGADHEAVLDHCAALVPGARTYRTHAFAESTHLLRALVARGYAADSNLCGFLQPGLVPLVHGAGVLRLPVWLEDDVLLDWAGPHPDPAPVLARLTSPGLKVLNFHPALVGANIGSLADYEAHRAALAAGTPIDPLPGRGAATLLAEVLDAAREAGLRIAAFEDVVTQALARLAAVDDRPYGWPRR